MKQVNWMVTVGKAIVKDNSIKYIPETYKNQLGNDEILTALVKSNVSFDNGQISFKVNTKSKVGRCQVVFNYDSNPMLLIGLNVMHGLFGIAKFNTASNKFEPLSVTGNPDTLNPKQDYEIKITLAGSLIDLYVNEVLVASAVEQISQSQVSFFLSSDDEINVKGIDISVRKPKAFVVMQFTDEYNDLYKEVIRPVVEEYGYECERADEAHTTNPILQDIIQSIKESSVIVADITPNNPNVFYEVGYAHAIEKPTILLCDRKRERLPFDISGFRTLFYDNTIAGKSAVEKSLKKYLETLS
jgi:hypothetical protein